MLTFHTETVYEVDLRGSRIRRVSGLHPVTPHQRAEGQWRTYRNITPIRVGEPVLIVWGSFVDGVLPRTQTSLVTAVTGSGG